MPRCALPDHLNSKEEIDANFPDDSQYSGLFGKVYRWIHKKTKTWFVFSYRMKRWPWRKVPITLLAIGDGGPWRYENIDGPDCIKDKGTLFFEKSPTQYLSRLQYYKRWSFIIQWPLMFTFHQYVKDEFVPKRGDPTGDNLDGKLIFAYYGHYDNDALYWLVVSAYAGDCFK